jgi:hypothetical protein
MTMYYGWFDGQDDVTGNFNIGAEALQDCEVLFAAYDGDYDGEALVVFRRDGMLYEVNGGHCSCYGLEDQWEPEETSIEALRHRVKQGTLGYQLGGYAEGFREMLDRLEAEGHV